MPEMAFPIRLADLVADQPVDRLRVGDAQQRLGEAHQRHPLLRGQGVFAEERVDAALAQPLAANRDDETARHLGDSIAQGGRDLGRCENAGHGLGLVEPVARLDRGPQRPRGRWWDRKHQIHTGSLAQPSRIRDGDGPPLACR